MSYIEKMRGAYGPNPFDIDSVLEVAEEAIRLVNPKLRAGEISEIARFAATKVLEYDE